MDCTQNSIVNKITKKYPNLLDPSNIYTTFFITNIKYETSEAKSLKLNTLVPKKCKPEFGNIRLPPVIITELNNDYNTKINNETEVLY
jgi:hypothetical protein